MGFEADGVEDGGTPEAVTSSQEDENQTLWLFNPSK